MRIVLLASVILQAINIGMFLLRMQIEKDRKLSDALVGSCFWFT